MCASEGGGTKALLLQAFFFLWLFYPQVMLRILCEIHRENIPEIQYIRRISIHKRSFADAK